MTETNIRMGRLADGAWFLVALVRAAYEEEIRYPAAALAYYAFVSFVPFMLLVFAVAGERFVDELARAAPQFLTPQVQRLVDQSVSKASGRTTAVVLAVAVLAWSGVNFVGDIRAVVRRIEGFSRRSFRHRMLDGVAIVGGIGAAILSIVATSTVFSFPFAGPAFGLDGFLALWAMLTVAFVPVYYVPSAAAESPRATLRAATLTAVGWTTIHSTVRFYAAHAGQYAVYGVLSGVIVLLTSLYAAAVVLLSGIIVTAWTAAEESESGPPSGWE